MKTTTLSLMLCFLPTLLFANPINRIAAVVDQQPITEAQLQRAIAEAKHQYKRHTQAPMNAKALRQMVLDQLINEQLQLAIAKRVAIEVTDKELDAYTEQVAKNNQLSEQALREALRDCGYSDTAFKAKMANQMQLIKLQRMAIAPKVHVTPETIKQLMQQANRHTKPSSYHVVDVRVSVPEQANAAQKDGARIRAMALRDKAMNTHEPLAKLAQSPEESSGLHVSDLGERRLEALPETFAKAIQSLQDGDISKPIEAANGLHLLQLVKSHKAQSLSEATARNIAHQRAFNNHLSDWLAELREDAYIQILDDDVGSTTA